MTRKIDLKNNFLEFTEEFRTDTGFDYKTNIELYIQYYNARMTDKSFQLNWHILNELIGIPDLMAYKIDNSKK